MNTPVPLLIVDDQARNLAVLESVLNSPDYQLVMVQSAQDALLALLNTDFAAVLLDVKMPEMNGYQLARLIHGRKANRSLPIIFVSGHRTDATDAHLGYEAGGVDYVNKPFDPAILRAKVSGLRRTLPGPFRVGRGGCHAAGRERPAPANPGRAGVQGSTQATRAIEN